MKTNVKSGQWDFLIFLHKRENMSSYYYATLMWSECWLRRCHSEVSLKPWGLSLFDFSGKLAMPEFEQNDSVRKDALTKLKDEKALAPERIICFVVVVVVVVVLFCFILFLAEV